MVADPVLVLQQRAGLADGSCSACATWKQPTRATRRSTPRPMLTRPVVPGDCMRSASVKCPVPANAPTWAGTVELLSPPHGGHLDLDWDGFDHWFHDFLMSPLAESKWRKVALALRRRRPPRHRPDRTVPWATLLLLDRGVNELPPRDPPAPTASPTCGCSAPKGAHNAWPGSHSRGGSTPVAPQRRCSDSRTRRLGDLLRPRGQTTPTPSAGSAQERSEPCPYL